jgi:RecB family endonuclease NucS
MDIIKTYKSNKNMTETERIEHLKQLNRVRRNRCYRKKKMEQLKIKQQQSSKITTQKVNLDEDIQIDSDEEDIKTLLELYEYIAIEPNDKEILEAIDILEDKL